MPTQRAIIKPELLVWAREEAGFSVEEAAKKAAVNPEQLVACEGGNARLTVNQLRSLGSAYKRPLAFFYLPQPPPRTANLRDFRRGPQEPEESETPALRYEIRRARYRRQVSIDLYEDIGEEPPRFNVRARLGEEPDAVAMRLRELLGVSREEQRAFRDKYEALGRWRNAVEQAGVMVFQASGIKGREMLGFSISEPILPVIVLNVSDDPLRRIFTLWHELAHIALRTGGLCTLREVQDIEVFCNGVAGSALVPQRWLLEETAVRGPQDEWSEAVLRTLAARYRVSREVILRRLLIANYATPEFYQRKHEEYHQEFEGRPDQGGFVPPDVKALSQSGRMFVQLVLEGYRQDKITTSDVIDYLEVRSKHLPSIARAVENPTLELGAA
jgi:Zn-dependent peptidase ImmA (M78 family)